MTEASELAGRTGADLAAFDPGQAVAIVPIGAMEFHGSHLPLGTDGYLADMVCRGAAVTGNAVVLPVQWVATGLMPKSYSLGLSPATAEAVLRETCRDLLRVGFAGVVCLSGHYSFAQRAMLARLQAVVLEAGDNCHAVTLPDLLPGSRTRFYDHAGVIETSLMMVARPDLTSLETIPRTAPHDWVTAFREYGISGAWPTESSVAQGQELARSIVAELSALVDVVRAGGPPARAAAEARLADTTAELARINAVYGEWITTGSGDIEQVWETPFREVAGAEEERWFRCCSG
jgi:creatinine amidohydrolase/Fe(II)-dependent formamide hydrolase-like protein